MNGEAEPVSVRLGVFLSNTKARPDKLSNTKARRDKLSNTKARPDKLTDPQRAALAEPGVEWA